MSAGVETAGLSCNSAGRSRLMTGHYRLLFALLPGPYLRALEAERQLKALEDGYTAYRLLTEKTAFRQCFQKSINKDYILLRQLQ
jgi:hypothetical protein